MENTFVVIEDGSATFLPSHDDAVRFAKEAAYRNPSTEVFVGTVISKVACRVGEPTISAA
jgi:hypothetical protein